ncbi:MAG: leucine-rich repeat domain-containing protein, partial [Spirochaetota bacterium]
YAQRAGIDAHAAGLSRTFSSLIHLYHPDRFAAIIRNIDAHAFSDDSDSLRALKNVYIFADQPAPRILPDLPEDSEEEYCYSDDDFGWTADKAPDEQEYAEEDEESEAGPDYEYTFTEAVNRHFYGNLDETVTVSDMNNLDGELDLSEYSVADLSGARHCINLASLNLSGNKIRSISALAYLERLEVLYLSENNIESIEPLRALAFLRELDLSFNQIEDFSVLLALPALEYVNCAGNRRISEALLSSLRKKGVIVIS